MRCPATRQVFSGIRQQPLFRERRPSHPGREHPATSGHDLLTPTLTGLGERAHLAETEIGLQTGTFPGVLQAEEELTVMNEAVMVAPGPKP